MVVKNYGWEWDDGYCLLIRDPYKGHLKCVPGRFISFGQEWLISSNGEPWWFTVVH